MLLLSGKLPDLLLGVHAGGRLLMGMLPFFWKGRGGEVEEKGGGAGGRGQWGGEKRGSGEGRRKEKGNRGDPGGKNKKAGRQMAYQHTHWIYLALSGITKIFSSTPERGRVMLT